MLIDLHMHEMTYSKDSFLALPRMVEIAREKGLDGICITDHDSMGLKDFAEEYSGRQAFRSLPGLNIIPAGRHRGFWDRRLSQRADPCPGVY